MKQLPWWRSSVFYQVYLPSFADGNNDGTGDFAGLIEHLDHIASLGVKGIWVTPFYPSPLVDNGYDISNYCDVDPRFGDLDLFKKFVDVCHERGIKVIIDLVVNHVSKQHAWFQDALNNVDSPYRDYFIFSKNPNNWHSFFSGSAWEKEEHTEYYYYHQFSTEQIDLNWANPQVEKEILNVIDFWIEQGVDGFRFDVINFLTTDGIGLDNPFKKEEQEHKYDINQPGVLDAVARIAQHIRAQGDYFLIGEVGSEDLTLLSQYQSAQHLDVVFNFNLGSQEKFDLTKIYTEMRKMNADMSGVPTLFFSSHDMPRMISRFGESERDIKRATAVSALQLTARGVPFIYNGEEIGMTDFIPETLLEISDIQGKNAYKTAKEKNHSDEQALLTAIKETRDNSRSPMQWNSSRHAGFSSVLPWMNINKNYRDVNVEKQLSDSSSILAAYKKLILIRNSEPVLWQGKYEFFEKNGEIIHFQRSLNNQYIEVVINFGETAVNPTFADSGRTLFGTDQQYIEKNEILIKKGSK
ncbi:alpha-glucosidase [Psychromonas aquimarina]|uniref:alpha-glucosidase n=1 Tax=Psychromonas aquimarina TaxID=444919 RepID=UPI00042589CA|nr:alpha-glucosidase [Psychromonas aquimarina]